LGTPVVCGRNDQAIGSGRPQYAPIEVATAIRSSESDLLECRWRGCALVADFVIPEDETQVLQVRFGRVEIVRILDEMPLSTEAETTPNDGIIPDHFAYTVEGALFWQSQSEALKLTVPRMRHYRFVTGWGCLDVLSQDHPAFVAVARSPT
jgi:hypothetical protein